MKFKVGDTVRVKSLDWYNENKDKEGDVECEKSVTFVGSMQEYCGMLANITSTTSGFYSIHIDDGNYVWQDFMFEHAIYTTIETFLESDFLSTKKDTFKTLLDAFWSDYRDFLLEKDKTYGSRYLHPLSILSDLSPQERLNARLDEKFGRLFAGNKDEDTLDDILGLLVHRKILIEQEKP
tara:strand:- start:4036 stop:4575 length:540 start_codon:yes stop_codon:yes gene_type:complete